MNNFISRTEGNWTSGMIGQYYFEIERSPAPSQSAIEFGGKPGHIIKLCVTRLKSYSTVCAYDRGWDKLPAYEEAQDVCDAIIRRFN